MVFHGTDYMVSALYEIRDNQLYEGSRDKHGMSIYRLNRLRGESKFHYIGYDSGDNGYCNWKIIENY
jgi:hypothetical protein